MRASVTPLVPAAGRYAEPSDRAGMLYSTGDLGTDGCCRRRMGARSGSGFSPASFVRHHPGGCSLASSLALDGPGSRTHGCDRGGQAPGPLGSDQRSTRTRDGATTGSSLCPCRTGHTQQPWRRSSSSNRPSSPPWTRTEPGRLEGLDGRQGRIDASSAFVHSWPGRAIVQSHAHSGRTDVPFYHSSDSPPVGHAAGRFNVAAAPVFVPQGAS